MLILSCTRNLNLLLLLSRMATLRPMVKLVPSSKLILQTVLPIGLSVVGDQYPSLMILIFNNDTRRVSEHEYKLPTSQNIDSIIDRMFQEKSLELKMNVNRASAIAITSES